MRCDDGTRKGNRNGQTNQAQHPRDLGRRHRHVEPVVLQQRHDGISNAEHRPPRTRRDDVHRLVRRAELHRGARVVHHRAERLSHGLVQGRRARHGRGPAGRGSDDRRAAEGAGLCDRPVRQEPPRRHEQVPADRPWLRRVLRQPLSPERRGGARGSGLSGPEAVSAVQGVLRTARRAALPGERQGRSHRAAALGPRRQAGHRGHRPADTQAHGDLRRRVRRRRQGLHQAPERGRQAVLLLAEHDPHALPDASEAGKRRPVRSRSVAATTTP